MAEPAGSEMFTSAGEHDWGTDEASLACLRPGCGVYFLDAGEKCPGGPCPGKGQR